MAWTPRGLGSAGHTGAATESRAGEPGEGLASLIKKKQKNKMKKTRIWPHDDVPHSDFQFAIVIISVGLGGWGRGGGGGSTAYGSAAFRQRLNDVFAALMTHCRMLCGE